MRTSTTSRSLYNWALLLVLGADVLGAGQSQAGAQAARRQQRRVLEHAQAGAQAPVVRQPPPAARQPALQPTPHEAPQPAPVERRDVPPPAGSTKLAPDRGHLAQWMNQHSNLTPAQQQQALQHEPAFAICHRRHSSATQSFFLS
jgi:hypothetical protein